jgi:hypothetical protein
VTAARPRPKELALAAALLALAGAALFGPQVAHGGFYWDDWSNSANVHFAGGPGLVGALEDAAQRPPFAYRPVLITLLTIEHDALGTAKRPHLVVAAAFGVLTAWSLYLLLRTLRLGRLDAAVPSALLLAFPWTDSTRLWSTASYDTLAVSFYLLGATLAVKALETRRRSLTAASLALYLMAAWTYEILAVAVLASVALYAAVAPRRAALRRFALDAAVAVVALVLVAIGTTRTPQPLADQVDHAVTIARQAFGLLARALVPVGEPPAALGAALLVLVAGGAALAYRRLAPGDERRPQIRTWLAATGLGALAVAAGYLLFVPALPHYEPLAPGTTNRMNVFAAVGYSVLAYALARLLATALPARFRAPAAAALCVAIGAGYVVQVADDQRGWQRSADVQAEVLAAVRATVKDPPPETTVYTFGAPSFVAPGVPSFSLSFDLRAAVQLAYDDRSLSAYPVRGLDVIECRTEGLQPVGGTYGEPHSSPYGLAVFVDVPRRRAIRIDSRAQCLRWRAALGAAKA